MENKYIYNGQDITLDIIMKIESVVSLIAERKFQDFDTTYLDFIESKTFAALQNTESVMWAESAEFIVDEYYREREEPAITQQK